MNKFKQNSSSGSFKDGDYNNIVLGLPSTSIVLNKDDLEEQNQQCIPKNELERLPSDAASEVDHYLYGTLKRRQ